MALAFSCSSERTPFHERTSSNSEATTSAELQNGLTPTANDHAEDAVASVQLAAVTRCSESRNPVVTSRIIQRTTVPPLPSGANVKETW